MRADRPEPNGAPEAEAEFRAGAIQLPSATYRPVMPAAGPGRLRPEPFRNPTGASGRDIPR